MDPCFFQKGGMMGTTLLITESDDWQPLDERYCELDGEAREADMSDFPGRLEQSAMVRMETDRKSVV